MVLGSWTGGRAKWRKAPEGGAPLGETAYTRLTGAKQCEARQRGAARPNVRRRQARAPSRGGCCGSAPALHWWCPAAGYWACAICVSPCLPIGKAGSDWTRERVPQKPNQNALQFSPSIELPGRDCLLRQCRQRSHGWAASCPLKGLDAQRRRPVQKPLMRCSSKWDASVRFFG